MKQDTKNTYVLRSDKTYFVVRASKKELKDYTKKRKKPFSRFVLVTTATLSGKCYYELRKYFKREPSEGDFKMDEIFVLCSQEIFDYLFSFILKKPLPAYLK